VGKGYQELRRQWRDGDVVRLEFPMKLQVVLGTHTNEGKLALMFGPLVLAVDERFLPEGVGPLSDITVDAEKELPLKVTSVKPDDALWEGEKVFETEGTSVSNPQQRFKLCLTDFAHASAKGTNFVVWLRRK
jgi:DUF1680 family protein